MTATETVRNAITNTKSTPSKNAGSPSYWADCLAQRAGLSPARLGSIYPEVVPAQLETIVQDVEWEEYTHPSINAPTRGYRAALPGLVGVASLSDLPATTTLVLDDNKSTGKLTPVAKGLPRSSVDFTVALVGPGKDGPIIWTFFPGDPIRESQLMTDNEFGLKHGDEITIEKARELGLEFVKVGE